MYFHDVLLVVGIFWRGLFSHPALLFSFFSVSILGGIAQLSFSNHSLPRGICIILIR